MCNDDLHVAQKMQRAGLKPLNLKERELLCALATLHLPWLHCKPAALPQSLIQALSRQFSHLELVHFSLNGADDVVKYRKWRFKGHQIAFGRSGYTQIMIERALEAGTDLDEGVFVVGPELPEFSSTEARNAITAGDEEAAALLLDPGVIAWHQKRKFLYY